MDPSLIAFIAAGVLGLVAFLFYNQASGLRVQLAEAKGTKKKAIGKSGGDAETKLKAAKKELATAKDSLNKKIKQLEEMRIASQKKAKKDAKKTSQKDAAEQSAKDSDASGSDDEKNRKHTQEVTKLKQALKTLEGEVSRAQNDAKDAVQNAESEALDQMSKKLATQKEAANSSNAAKSKIQKTLDELRDSIKKKSEARPDVEGSGLDLKVLDTEVVQELAKFYRKGEHFEKLYHVNQGQLQLAKDKNQELQKRYYAVCRELAVAATDKKDVSEEDAVRLAEAVSERTDRTMKPANAKGPKGKGQQERKEGGEGKKRRRRKPKGETKKADANDANGEEVKGEKPAANELKAQEGDSANPSENASDAKVAESKPVKDNTEAATEEMSSDAIAGAIAKPDAEASSAKS
ncbi:MAG: hypothetical protein GY822_24295 [Deltaproteobacteria bacterium]|nr:hypothetical protein [Deltaproteobacteria bacterium]